MKKLILYSLFVFGFMASCAQNNVEEPKVSQEIKTISVEEFSEKLNSIKEKLILDVRTPGEVATGAISGAVAIDYNDSQFETEIDKLDKSKSIFLYCKSGGRSGAALEILKEKGFNSVYNLQGGMMAWSAANLPINVNAFSPLMEEEWTSEKFTKLLEDNQVVLVDYYAQWCAPCKRMKPALDALEKKYEGKVKILRLDVDKSPILTKNEGVSALPTIILYKQGQRSKVVSKEMNQVELEELIK
jgi:thioredoxin 1